MRKLTGIEIHWSGARVASEVAPDVNITYADVDPSREPDLLLDITKEPPKELVGKFDIVWCIFTLHRLEREAVLAAAKNVAKFARPMSEVWFMVPSVEWAAKRIQPPYQDNDPIVQIALYGEQDNPYHFTKSGFDLYSLRRVLEASGCSTRTAYSGPWKIVKDGMIHQSEQNIVMGLRTRK